MDLNMGIGLACLLLVVYAVMDLVKSFGKSETEDKLKARLAGNLKTRDQVKSEKEAGLLRGDRALARAAWEQMLAKLEIVAKVQTKLEQADLDVSASKVLGIASAACVVVLVGGLLAQMNPVVAFLLAPVPLVATLYVINFLVRRRRNMFVEQMPDAFELMVQSLRAGHALAGAIQMVGEQMPDPIGKEMARVFAEQNLGMRLEDALGNLVGRIDTMDVRFFVSAVLIQRTTGGDLAEVLEKIASLIQGRIELYGQVKSLTAEGRLSGWVLLSLPPACLAYTALVNPDYVKPLFTDTIGKAMLLAAGISMLLGMAIIKKIVTIEV